MQSMSGTSSAASARGANTQQNRPDFFDHSVVTYVLSTVAPDALRALGETFPAELAALHKKFFVIRNRLNDTDRSLSERNTTKAVSMLSCARDLAKAAESVAAALGSSIEEKNLSPQALGDLPRFIAAVQKRSEEAITAYPSLQKAVQELERKEKLTRALEDLLPIVLHLFGKGHGAVIGTVQFINREEGFMKVKLEEGAVMAFPNQSAALSLEGKAPAFVSPENFHAAPKRGSQVVLAVVQENGRERKCAGWIPVHVALKVLAAQHKSLAKSDLKVLPSKPKAPEVRQDRRSEVEPKPSAPQSVPAQLGELVVPRHITLSPQGFGGTSGVGMFPDVKFTDDPEV